MEHPEGRSLVLTQAPVVVVLVGLRAEVRVRKHVV